MAIIDVSGLTKAFGETIANDDLTFSVEPGEIFGYLGPNGAGKTTTLRTLLGFLSPTEGTATVLGADIRDEDALLEAKRDIGYLPGELHFTESVTGHSFLEYQASLKGDDRLDEMTDLFQPPLDRKIREYSSGNRQMLGIIQTFMHDPDLVVMDEPTRGLDPLMQERLNSFLRAERAAGTTVLFSSHVLGEVRRVCDRVGIIRDGRLVALENIESLLRKGGKRVRINTDEPVDVEAFDLDGIIEVEQVGKVTRFTFTGDYNRLLETLSAYSIVDMEIEEPPLEEVFLHYYGDEDD
ncbi:ABC-type multidrug transport system, ATPase component [Halanaeroarchaeum sp. HSR-CO]|uniref:ABC transporter ATP-binding protein n=1 Tax=Halanaeroarchaeum sp. HSR-CO TaxID=2866382 RepID=UPI00217EF38A|nr:ABC transporter ATP-binding protein [Halanaeroarchaeum sp. HSR-CO]UWG47731.1 ABC-type multidrug transport system, ATPase component [Halanaeroarchaeum sp. HSR-CO]